MATMERLALSEVCHCLAVLFYDPQEFLPGGAADFFNDYRAAFSSGDAELVVAFQALEQAAQQIDLTRLRVDYAALFVGPGELRACPYGSVHLEKGYQLYGETTLRVADLYAQAGLRLGAESGTVPDHIAVELEFLHFLLHRMANADTSPPAHIYPTFLQRFFQPFARQLADLLIRRAETDFYRLLGRMLQRLTVVLARTIELPPAEAGSRS
ncbi:MAG: molecular chaperone TorD family protein [Desulforhopalus sp.]|jgi:TorA maturation chaperone TorD|nr:molecular chaperone TorD family protein [Desulforhopalus sp.]